MNGPAVGESDAALLDVESIGAPAFETWFAGLTPAQKRGVAAVALVDGTLADYPPTLSLEALEVAPTAASIAAQAQVAAQVAGDVPPLVELASGDVFYTAGGPTYRKVPGALTFAALGLNTAAIVHVDELAAGTGAPWPAVSTPATAFVDVGRLVAASGDVAAAIALARFAARYLGVSS